MNQMIIDYVSLLRMESLFLLYTIHYVIHSGGGRHA
jgi:hypothetical protein